MEDNSKDKFRDSIGDLLNDLPDEVPGLDETPELSRVKIESTQAVALTKAKGKAKKVMSSLLKFYLSEEIIAEHEYIQAKSNLDEYALGMLIRQMENSEIAISQLMVVLDSSIVNIAIPSAKADLGITDANQQWVITAYTLAFGSLLLIGGRIGDFMGRKKIFIVGLVGFAAVSALGGIASNQELYAL